MQAYSVGLPPSSECYRASYKTVPRDRVTPRDRLEDDYVPVAVRTVVRGVPDRYFMYPQTLLLGAAAIGRWMWIRWISIPMVVIGAGISTYHYILERFPDDVSSSCSTEVPCTTVWIWKYHFMSIPAMAWLAFVTIGVLLLLARRSDPVSTPSDTEADQRVIA